LLTSSSLLPLLKQNFATGFFSSCENDGFEKRIRQHRKPGSKRCHVNSEPGNFNLKYIRINNLHKYNN
jgi:hypothetical protein